MSPPSEQDNRSKRGEARRASPAAAPATAELVLTAAWVAPSIARDWTRRFLAAHRWSPAHSEDLVLAVSEAVSNSVEHGYGLAPEDADYQSPLPAGGTVELSARVRTGPDGSRRVEFTVSDHGTWIPPAPPGTRGQGLLLMRACTDEFVLDPSPDGTTVVLRSRPLPASRLVSSGPPST